MPNFLALPLSRLETPSDIDAESSVDTTVDLTGKLPRLYACHRIQWDVERAQSELESDAASQ